MKPEQPNGMHEVDGKLNRRTFLKKAAGVAALFVLPIEYCSNGSGDDGGGSGGAPCISFEITFNKPMDRASVEGALSIDPAVDGFFSGEFTWTNGDTTVYYKGNVPEEGQAYTVTIGGAAQSKGGNFLDGNGDGTGGDAYGFEVLGV